MNLLWRQCSIVVAGVFSNPGLWLGQWSAQQGVQNKLEIWNESSHTHTHTHAYTVTQTTHKHTGTSTHTDTHKQTNTHTYTNTHLKTHTQTHTHFTCIMKIPREVE